MWVGSSTGDIDVDISQSITYATRDSANGRMKLVQASRPRGILLADFLTNAAVCLRRWTLVSDARIG